MVGDVFGKAIYYIIDFLTLDRSFQNALRPALPARHRPRLVQYAPELTPERSTIGLAYAFPPVSGVRINATSSPTPYLFKASDFIL